MNKVLLLCSVFALAIVQPVLCDQLSSLTGSARAAQLRAAAGDPIIEVQLRNPGVRLIPSHERLRNIISQTMGDIQPTILVETLSIFTKPGVHSASAQWSEAEQTALFNQLTAISTLTGIEYFSASRQAMRIFYESSYVIDNASDKNPLPDPVFSNPVSPLTLYARQKDLTFGDNIYRYDYHVSEDAILLVQENITSMNIGIIRAVGSNRFRTTLAVIDAGDSLLIYAAAMARAVALPGLGERISASFTNRVVAVLTWFNDRSQGVFSASGALPE